MGFPKDHWAKIHSTDLLERLNGEIKRRPDVNANAEWSDNVLLFSRALLVRSQ
jgi:transposase-like protein